MLDLLLFLIWLINRSRIEIKDDPILKFQNPKIHEIFIVKLYNVRKLRLDK